MNVIDTPINPPVVNREKYSAYTTKIAAKIRLFKRKLKMGHEVSLFHKRGNGIATLLERTGRINDLKGLFVISSASKEALILGESAHVLADIQKLTRGKRAMDKMALKIVAQHYGFSSYKMGRELLLAASVNWIEVTDKSFRTMLKRAMMPMVIHVL